MRIAFNRKPAKWPLVTALTILMVLSSLLQACSGASPQPQTESKPTAKVEAAKEAPKEASKETPKSEPAKEQAKPDASKPAVASGAPIKIAFVAPLTGDLAALGKMAKQGITLALEDINGAGGIKGRQIEIIEEDAGASITTALNALNKVLEQKPVAVIGGVNSATAMAMIPVIDKEGIPYLTGGTAPGVFQSGSKWVFGINPSDDVGAGALVNYAVEKLGAKKVGLITTNDEPGQTMIEAIKKALKKYNQDLVVEVHGPTDKDMSAQLLSIKNKGVQAILVWDNPVGGPLIVKQSKQLKIDLPLLTNFAGYAQALGMLTNEEASGLIGTSFAAPQSSDDPAVKAWVARFKAKFNQAPDGTQSHPYDAFKILAKVIEQNGDSRDAIRQGMSAVKGYKGLSGEFTYDSAGIGRHDVVILSVQSDKTIKIMGVVSGSN
ncbi:MAG: ABC transporter substrate-binding protein [Chloroflexi bacterium]|nr:ABC transporter substrate-binding protein [Chloroflexota bacterium]